MVPQIPVWVSFHELLVKGHECHLAAAFSEVYALNSFLCCLGNSSINFILLLSQPYYPGQLPSRRAGEHRSRQNSFWGKHLHHRGECIWNGEFKRVLLLHQQPAAILTASGLPLLKAPLHFWLRYFPFWKLCDVPPGNLIGGFAYGHWEKSSGFLGIINSQGDSTVTHWMVTLKCAILPGFQGWDLPAQRLQSWTLKLTRAFHILGMVSMMSLRHWCLLYVHKAPEQVGGGKG